MVKHRKQHTVPNCYLKAWVDPNTQPGHAPYVHLFDLHGENARRKSPSNILHMPDIYTIFRNGERDLQIEQALGSGENAFIRVRSILEGGQLGTHEDASALYAFVGAMLARQPQRINSMAAQWALIAERMQEVRVNLNPNALPIRSLADDGPKINLAQVKDMAANPMGTWFASAVASYINVLSSKFGCDVLVNETLNHSFLTRDGPAFIYHPLIAGSQQRNIPRGLGTLGCEITLPVSPRLALLFRHKSPGIHGFLQADWETVFELNHRTISGATETIISDTSDIFFVRAITQHIAKFDAEHPSRDGKTRKS